MSSGWFSDVRSGCERGVSRLHWHVAPPIPVERAVSADENRRWSDGLLLSSHLHKRRALVAQMARDQERNSSKKTNGIWKKASFHQRASPFYQTMSAVNGPVAASAPMGGAPRQQRAFKTQDKPDEVRRSNMNAAKAVSDAIRTSLGPKGMDKMVRKGWHRPDVRRL